jgi:hypothetical protein
MADQTTRLPTPKTWILSNEVATAIKLAVASPSSGLPTFGATPLLAVLGRAPGLAVSLGADESSDETTGLPANFYFILDVTR